MVEVRAGSVNHKVQENAESQIFLIRLRKLSLAKQPHAYTNIQTHREQTNDEQGRAAPVTQKGCNA